MKDKTQLEAIDDILKKYARDVFPTKESNLPVDRRLVAQQILDLCQPNIKACERITVIALKYCPKNHHDWEELKALSYKIIPSTFPGESE